MTEPTKTRINLSSYDNRWYKPGGTPFKRALWYFVNALFFLNPLNPSSGLKVSILRRFGAKIGAGATIKPRVNIKYPWHLEIGDHVWLGEGAWIDNLVRVKIGSDVCISQGAMLETGNHNYKSPHFDLVLGEITMEDGVWIGAKAIVGPGVTCQSHAVLCAGSVATQDLEPYSVYQGNPAVKIRGRIIEPEQNP